MKKVISTLIYCQIILLIFLCSPLDSFGQTTVYCTPSDQTNMTGRVNSLNTKTSGEIKVGDPYNRRGWARFSILSIPSSAIIETVKLQFYVNSASGTDHDLVIRYVTSNPLTATGSTLNSEISTGTWLGDCSGCCSSTGYKTITLNSSSVSLLQTRVNNNTGWFAVGFWEWDDDANEAKIDGYDWGGTPEPILIVTYTSNPDITISNSQVSQPSPLYPGGTFDVSCEQHISNGSSTTVYPNVGYYLSTNATCTTSDTYLDDDESSLSSSDTYDGESATLTIPSGTSSGNYYICFIGDYQNEVSESDENNNCKFLPITVSPGPPPDITITNPSVTQTTVCPGDAIDVSCEQRISNGSSTTVYPNVGYYLSTNATCTTSDTYLDDDESSLSSSDTYDGESETLIIPSGTSPGTYYVCFIGDYLDEVSESNENNNCEHVTITVVDPPTLSISPSNQNVSSGSGSTTFSVSSNISWSANDNVSWLSLSPTSGSNDGTITASYSENTSTSSRTATITVSGSGVSDEYVTVTQEPTGYLTISPSNQDVSSGSGSTTFSVSSNISWSASDNASWLTLSPTSGSNGGTITASYFENTSTSSRTATITVSGSGVSDEYVTVTQEPTGYLTISPSNQDVNSESGSTTFSISSNISWSANDNASWLTLSPTSGSNNGTITANYSKNTSTSIRRTDTITFSGSGVSDVNVTVIQDFATSIDNPVSKNQIKIYPNPTNSILIIESSVDINYIKIYDLLGRLVYESKFKQEIDISNFDEGIYLLKLYSKEGEILKTEKIIVNK